MLLPGNTWIGGSGQGEGEGQCAEFGLSHSLCVLCVLQVSLTQTPPGVLEVGDRNSHPEHVTEAQNLHLD